MIVHIPFLFVKPIVVASVHGLHDIRHGPEKLSLYCLAMTPLPHVSQIFVVASARHFSHDVGITCSLLLHIAWIVLPHVQHAHAAWVLFTMYYVFVHSFPKLFCWFCESWTQLGLCVLCALFAAQHVTTNLPVDEHVQKIVIAHVVLDEMNKWEKESSK